MLNPPQIEERELGELAQFVINRKTENLRDELHDYLVEIGLSDVNRYVRSEDIAALVKDKFGFSDFPQQIVDLAIPRLQKSDKVDTKVEGSFSTYSLHESRKKELHEMVARQKALCESVTDTVIAKIQSKLAPLSENDKKVIAQSLFDFLGKAFAELSTRFATAIMENSTESQSLGWPLFSEKELLEKSFSQILEKKLRETAISSAVELFEKPDDKTSLFLYSLSQGYILLQVLNIDPQCQALQREIFLANVKTYLDTNLMVDLLCERWQIKFHATATRLVALTKSLGIEICYTKRTHEELEKRLELSNKTYGQEIRQINWKRRVRMLGHIEDPFIEEYLLQLKTNPYLRWEGFFGRMKNFVSILERKYGLLIDRSDYSNVLKNPEFAEVLRIVSEANPGKMKSTVEHDSFHLVLVDMLRSGVNPENSAPRYWFVTRDKSVCMAEAMRLFLERKKGVEKKPSSVLIDVWINMISPFLSPKAATEDASRLFAQIFSTHFIPSFPKIRPKIIFGVLRPLLDQRDLHADEIRAIISDVYLAEHFDELSRNGKLQFYINNKLLRLQEKKHREELEKAQAEKLLLEEQIRKSKEESIELSKTLQSIKRFGRYLAGALVFFFVWAITYLVILLPAIKETGASFLGSVVIALIFGYLLGFQRYEWILEKALSIFRSSKS